MEELSSREGMEALLAVWEASVRATHHFLTEDDISGLRPLVLQGLATVPRLFVVRDEGGNACGFMGLDGPMLEMLFLAPQARGKGLGRALAQKALAEGVRFVDVNEQNPGALGFYQHLGFTVRGRSPLDGQGRPFPLLHMEYAGGLRPAHE